MRHSFADELEEFNRELLRESDQAPSEIPAPDKFSAEMERVLYKFGPLPRGHVPPEGVVASSRYAEFDPSKLEDAERELRLLQARRAHEAQIAAEEQRQAEETLPVITSIEKGVTWPFAQLARGARAVERSFRAQPAAPEAETGWQIGPDGQPYWYTKPSEEEATPITGEIEKALSVPFAPVEYAERRTSIGPETAAALRLGIMAALPKAGRVAEAAVRAPGALKRAIAEEALGFLAPGGGPLKPPYGRLTGVQLTDIAGRRNIGAARARAYAGVNIPFPSEEALIAEGARIGGPQVGGPRISEPIISGPTIEGPRIAGPIIGGPVIGGPPPPPVPSPAPPPSVLEALTPIRRGVPPGVISGPTIEGPRIAGPTIGGAQPALFPPPETIPPSPPPSPPVPSLAAPIPEALIRRRGAPSGVVSGPRVGGPRIEGPEIGGYPLLMISLNPLMQRALTAIKDTEVGKAFSEVAEKTVAHPKLRKFRMPDNPNVVVADAVSLTQSKIRSETRSAITESTSRQLDMNPKEVSAIKGFLTAEDVIARWDTGIERFAGGISRSDAVNMSAKARQDFIDAGIDPRAQSAKFDAEVAKYREWAKTAFDRDLTSGHVVPEQERANYVPHTIRDRLDDVVGYRMLTDTALENYVSTGKVEQGISRYVGGGARPIGLETQKAARGSFREIEEPYSAMMLRDLASRRRAHMAELIQRLKPFDLSKDIESGAVKLDTSIHGAYELGRGEIAIFPKDLAIGLSEASMLAEPWALTKLLRAVNNVVKAGRTTFNPFFHAKQLTQDINNALMRVDIAKTPEAISEITSDYFRLLGEFKKEFKGEVSPILQERRRGGTLNEAYESVPPVVNDVRRITDKATARHLRPGGIVGKLAREAPGELIEATSQARETAIKSFLTREFERSGMSREQAVIEANRATGGYIFSSEVGRGFREFFPLKKWYMQQVLNIVRHGLESREGRTAAGALARRVTGRLVAIGTVVAIWNRKGPGADMDDDTRREVGTDLVIYKAEDGYITLQTGGLNKLINDIADFAVGAAEHPLRESGAALGKNLTPVFEQPISQLVTGRVDMTGAPFESLRERRAGITDVESRLENLAGSVTPLIGKLKRVTAPTRDSNAEKLIYWLNSVGVPIRFVNIRKARERAFYREHPEGVPRVRRPR